MMFSPEPASPVLLAGDARARGLAQASAPGTDGDAVRRAIRMRLDASAAMLERAHVRALLAEQAAVLAAIEPEGAAELDGVAEGFGVARSDLLAYLHLGLVADIADGCSAWAHSGGGVAPLLVKNRDYRGEHAALQRVFLHRDPARPDWWALCVGSLGSPGAFSSGMNSAGLALVDTHVGTHDHGPGLLRYFLMTRLLRTASTVDEALAEIAAVPQAGGGTLVLADRSGRHAAVELGHAASAVEVDEVAWRARTNHFLLAETSPSFRAHGSDPMAASTTGRLARLYAALGRRGPPPGPADAAALMAGHADEGQEGRQEALCRHGEDGDSLTISTAIFAPAEAALYFSPQRPCAGRWLAYRMGPPGAV